MRRHIPKILVASLLGGIAMFAAGPFFACYVVAPLRHRPHLRPSRTADCGATIPALTSQQIETVQTIALADARVQKILAGDVYDVETTPWTAGSCLIGGVPQFQLQQPVRVELDWPAVEWNEADERPIYPPQNSHFTVTGLTDFYVFVDLQRGEVVQIMPGIDANIDHPITIDVVLGWLRYRLLECPD